MTWNPIVINVPGEKQRVSDCIKRNEQYIEFTFTVFVYSESAASPACPYTFTRSEICLFVW